MTNTAVRLGFAHPVGHPVRPSAFLAAALLAVAGSTSPARAQPAVASPSLCDALAGNLVQNCGFEVGSLADWSMLNPPGSNFEVPDLPTSAHTGRHMLRLSGFTTARLLSSVATVPGGQYTFTFYLVSLGVGAESPSSSAFAAYFGGQQVFSLLGQGPLFDDGYARYSFTETATDATTELRFDARNGSAAYNLDDVSVTVAPTATPEPATVALVGGGLVALGAARRRARRR